MMISCYANLKSAEGSAKSTLVSMTYVFSAVSALLASLEAFGRFLPTVF